MAQKWVEAFVQQRIREMLENCCNEQDEFYTLYSIFCDEARYINPTVAEILLDFEEKMNVNLSYVEKVYRSGFEDGFTVGEIKQP
ncbi:hypothetical protein WJ0W_005825 [Paenibacillus melissococcoides]|uniref:Uncharacterized protein n=1 Tax=Paenibacillus melissococcoides TaxID=2912268 RepID=A0ABM9G9D3_9BACL|nr:MULTISPECIES: hypothetical protein [Paenibacillus]MEB9892688.1 hypothetical protein [Bacillus cereus]CAH8248641.1 hypothetical protein WJ0W_005825 [Paenibacillus melissococcoides]CAH8714163.1 hypothetical protein WDD9_003787 [Paenibacillus melissococcoides]CAH8720069.1 hypothetical protein HTL2_005820 [Paenibacillus melissococcoides]GIO81481.1 hypothetical protein J6TS7_50910 [Paenibacillus dendritiformis]